MNEKNLTCLICGGLHPAGHRDKELEEKLEAVRTWYKENIPEWIYLRDYDVERSPTIMSSKLLELKKILEAEG